MGALTILVAYYAIALVGPFVAGLFNVNPYDFDPDAISDLGGRPYGDWGGITPSHPLGVEWGTGRDIAAQLLYGLRISLVIATTATFITVTLGTVIGIVAGYTGGKTDNIIGRLMDLVLAFPQLLIILALSGVLTQRLTAMGVPEGNPSRILYLILVISIFGWPYLARIVRGQVLSFREREFVEAAVAMGSSKRR
ncbi:MAG: ABC transporter permease, partial [Chloroflexi bacterium]|nr:ABC transporter permease [Chloroflexota bacterium]